jgi:ribosomal protein S19E (S16A)
MIRRAAEIRRSIGRRSHLLRRKYGGKKKKERKKENAKKAISAIRR